MKKRQSGVLMHISSLPGKYGIGSFGQAAYDLSISLFGLSNGIGKFCLSEQLVMEILRINLSQLLRVTPTLLTSIS